MISPLMQRHPWQWPRCRGLNVPPAWLSTLSELSDAVADRVTGELEREAFSWHDIKEKHGALSIDYAGPDVDDLVDAAIEQIDMLIREK